MTRPGKTGHFTQYDCRVGLRPGVRCGVECWFDIVIIMCSSIHSVYQTSKMLLRQTADVLFSHLQVPLQSLFLAPAYPPPAKRGFTCPGHLQVATARRLAALETLVPNPPSQPPIPPPSTLNGQGSSPPLRSAWVISIIQPPQLRLVTLSPPPVRLSPSFNNATVHCVQIGLGLRLRLRSPLVARHSVCSRTYSLHPPAKKCASCSSLDSLEPLGFWSTPPTRPPPNTIPRCNQTLRP